MSSLGIELDRALARLAASAGFAYEEESGMAELRVVKPDEPAGVEVVTCTMGEALLDVCARVAACRASVAMVLYEMPGGRLEMCTLPGSTSLARGMIDRAYALLFPDGASPT